MNAGLTADTTSLVAKLDEHYEAPLPGGSISTAGDLAEVLRELLTVGCQVDRYLFGKDAALAMAYGASKSVALTVGGKKPRRELAGIAVEDGIVTFGQTIAHTMEDLSRRPAGVKVSEEFATVLADHVGAPPPGQDERSIKFHGLPVIVSPTLKGWQWEFIW